MIQHLNEAWDRYFDTIESQEAETETEAEAEVRRRQEAPVYANISSTISAQKPVMTQKEKEIEKAISNAKQNKDSINKLMENIRSINNFNTQQLNLNTSKFTQNSPAETNKNAFLHLIQMIEYNLQTLNTYNIRENEEDYNEINIENLSGFFQDILDTKILTTEISDMIKTLLHPNSNNPQSNNLIVQKIKEEKRQQQQIDDEITTVESYGKSTGGKRSRGRRRRSFRNRTRRMKKPLD